jgi:glycerol-1-phosphate dehydrogenase [NAD(P)+]
MMGANIPVYIGDGAIDAFLGYCSEKNLRDFLLVADGNTYAALGEKADAALRSRGYDVITVVLEGAEIQANEHYLVRVLLKYDCKPRTFISAGSGTITDITRFVSHRTRSPFIALPTAPSVDGFTSIGAPLVVGGLKQTIVCQAPQAVFADLPTLTAAPRRLVAAGFGDLVGKYFSIADWKLAHLLWGERYVEHIAAYMLGAAVGCAAQVEQIAGGSPESTRLLMDGLVQAGFGMLEYGNTSPAGGAEHHIAHHWEMMMLSDRRPAALHGAKVGIASLISAAWYAEVRRMSREEAARRLQDARLPDPQDEIAKIRSTFGPLADELVDTQKEFLALTPEGFQALKGRILDNWDAVQQIAAGVPEPEQLAGWLRTIDGPLDARQVGLTGAEVRLAADTSHYMRNRFTINKLRLLLGLPTLVGV